MKLKFLQPLMILTVMLAVIPKPAVAQLINPTFENMKHRPDGVVMPKVIHGVVQDMHGKPIPNAKVFVREIKTNIVRTLTTDKDGAYTLAGLPPTVDYEVSAQFLGKDSAKKVVSSFVTREDNLVSFQLDVVFDPGTDDNGPTLKTFDLVQLRASLEMPTGVPAPVPAVLLLHGYGEDRTVWEPLKNRFVQNGWAVMTLDLRGHGKSTIQNEQPLHPSPDWRTDSRQFPLDLEPAVNWLKSQPRLDSRKIVIIGSDVGADLALLGSGRFPSVKTVVAINPKLSESLAMAGSAQDFTAKSVLILTSDAAGAEGFTPYIKGPVSIRSFGISGGTANWLANKDAVDAIFSWIQQTY